jgi:hypothetical protein
MPNPLSSLWDSLSPGVKEGAKQAPAVALLTIALTTYIGGKWISKSGCQELRDSDARETEELREQRNEYKRIAYNCTGIVVETAQQTAKINAEVNPVSAKPNASPSPVVATVRVPLTPLTAEEKNIEKPRDAEPETLERSLNVSTSVLKKADVSKAEPVLAKKAVGVNP